METHHPARFGKFADDDECGIAKSVAALLRVTPGDTSHLYRIDGNQCDSDKPRRITQCPCDQKRQCGARNHQAPHHDASHLPPPAGDGPWPVAPDMFCISMTRAARSSPPLRKLRECSVMSCHLGVDALDRPACPREPQTQVGFFACDQIGVVVANRRQCRQPEQRITAA